ncbi:MAG: hypothetical protein DRP64_02530 [Verrucomicrobia bacterium]|nr:MAG: hypothetical protein DRP64_02530 [Verrucomicrobiota bacterium]
MKKKFIRLSITMAAVLLSGAVALAATNVVSFGDAGYGETGSWANAGGGYSFARYDTTSTDETASWSFNGLADGLYAVYTTWTFLGNRSTNAPYAFTDGMASNTVNQRFAPAANLVLNNGTSDFNFQKLGLVYISDGDFMVTLSSDGEGGADTFVIADAVALVPADAYVVSVGEEGYSDTGAPWGNAGSFRFVNDGNAGASASWTFSGLADGTYGVLATWVQDGNRSPEAPYSFSQGLATVTVNQKLAPAAHHQAEGYDLQMLGQVAITGGVFTVTLTDDDSTVADTFVIAQAVALVTTDALVIDNLDSGYSEAGPGWATWQGQGEYGSDFRFVSGSTSNNTASWAFTGLQNGIYDVLACWPADPSASPSAPYSGSDGFATATVNQTNAPSADKMIFGTAFQNLGSVTVIDGTFTGNVTGGAAQLRADAMALVQVAGLPPILQIASDGSALDFAWSSLVGKLYDLESTDSLTEPVWSGYGGYTNIMAVGDTTTVTNVPAAGPEMFFRVIEK